MAPLSFLMVFLPSGGQVFRTVKDGDNPDGAPERSGTPGSDSIWPPTGLHSALNHRCRMYTSIGLLV
jgi:hypothetical protein